MKEPWFYSRSFIKDKSEYLRGDVIDIGCGNSKYKSIISGFSGVKSFTGIDFIGGPGVDIIADLNKPLPLPDNSYDSAICISVLEHLLEPKASLEEMNRILKPGGFMLVAVPWIFPFHPVPNDYFRFSREALEYLFKKAGFEVVYTSSSGGKFRILLTFLVRWFPIAKKFSYLFDRFLSKVDSKKKNEECPNQNTPSYHIVIRKIEA